MHFRIIIQKQLSENKDQCYKNQRSELEECKVRVLIVGSGGRESALAWKCKRSPLLTELFVAPGNPSLQSLARGVATDIKTLPAFVRSHSIDLVICGPEQHIAAGLADALQAQGSAVFAPSQACARLEASKSFAKKIMQRAAVPTAAWQAVNNADTCKAAALARLHDDGGVVLKADGLASGKGVFVWSHRKRSRTSCAASVLTCLCCICHLCVGRGIAGRPRMLVFQFYRHSSHHTPRLCRRLQAFARR